MFEFERWELWLSRSARTLQEVGYAVQFRSGGPPTPKPCCSFIIESDIAVGQFTVWVTGEADFDVMDLPSKGFAHHVWGIILDDLGFEGVFNDFLARVISHPSPGQDIPASMRSPWFSAKSGV